MVSNRIFRSRWAALLWAAGVIWTAYDVAEANSPPPANQSAAAKSADASANAASAQDMQGLANFIDG
ncbi:MAG TPA: hypothetical protein VFT56_07785 [Sphingomonas sp.]|nr:hypothetical protein [Sphingomonas sp.]